VFHAELFFPRKRVSADALALMTLDVRKDNCIVTHNSTRLNDSDQALASAADEIWKEVKTALRYVPLNESACKAKILEELKAKASRAGSLKALASAAHEIWRQVKALPLNERARKAKILEELKAKASRDLVKTALLKAITESPDNYLSLLLPGVDPLDWFTPNRCLTTPSSSRGNVCLSMSCFRR